MATYTYNNTDSYSENKRKYEANLQTIKQSYSKIATMYDRIMGLVDLYPYELRALPVKEEKNAHGASITSIADDAIESMDVRERRNILNVIVSEIKKSDNIKEEEKESLIKEIRKIFSEVVNKK